LYLFGRESQPDLLPDLGLVLGDLGLDWEEGAATQRSRLGPEGGNPAEETAAIWAARHPPPPANNSGKR
jgi:hypothetical protein